MQNDRTACVLGVANLAALHEVFATHGAERVIVSAHMRDTSDHDLVRTAFHRDVVTIVRLRADDQTIAEHGRDRSSGSEARLAGDDLVGASARQQADIVRQAQSQHKRLDARADEDVNIPLPEGEVDHVVCSLALAHLRDLRPFFSEAARVMRPGGHLLLLDTRGHFTGSSRYPLVKESPDGQVGYMPGYSHSLGDYIRTALPHGYVVRACEETHRDDHTVEVDELPEPLTPGPPDVWELHPWVRDAANAAKKGQPAVVAWDLELRPDV